MLNSSTKTPVASTGTGTGTDAHANAGVGTCGLPAETGMDARVYAGADAGTGPDARVCADAGTGTVTHACAETGTETSNALSEQPVPPSEQPVPSSNQSGSSTEKLEVIFGANGLQRLRDARVMVLGCGGVGSNCIEALARGGVGALICVDKDYVSASNINRQAIAFHSTLGKRKVDVMRAMILDINPHCTVETHDTFLQAASLPEFLQAHARSVDWIVDAIDCVSVKLALAEYACEQGLPLISSMGGGNKLHPEFLQFADIYETKTCPLCRVMRKEARKRNIAGLRVLYSSEQPAQTQAREGATRADRSDLGTMSYMPPIMGQMIAGWVIRRIVGIDANGQ